MSRIPTDVKAAPAGSLARRMFDYTNKGLFTALVLVAGAAFGRQVISWWRVTEPPQPRLPVGGAFDDDDNLVHLLLGELPYDIQRQTVAGSLDDALGELVAACREAVAAAEPFSPAATDEERRFLEFLDKTAPEAADESAGWRVYRAVAGMPLVAGTRRLSDAERTERGKASPARNRVVLWGLAAPDGPDRWTLYRFQAAGGRGPRGPQRFDVPVPPGCRRLLASSDDAGRGMMAFQGSTTCDACRRFYADWIESQRPGVKVVWHSSGGGWHARIADEMTIQLTPDARGGCIGLVVGGRMKDEG